LTRLTDAPGADWYPVWTPDGRRMIFARTRADGNGHDLLWQAADNTGTVERLTTSLNRVGPASISPDGTRLIVMETMLKTGWDLHVLRLDALSAPSEANPSAPLAGRSRPTEPLVQTTAAELFGELSPDGHWLAYQSDEAGQNQIWVRPFPNVDGGQWQISTGGGITPVWARNGKELSISIAPTRSPVCRFRRRRPSARGRPRSCSTDGTWVARSGAPTTSPLMASGF
jgi:eukaryotic-like serine/threonine-protein kinase